MSHLIRTERRIAINDQTKKAFFGGRMIARSLPLPTRHAADNRTIRFGVAADFDGTLVPTDEINRQFFYLGRYEDSLQSLSRFKKNPLLLQTPVLNRNLLSGLAMLGIPTGVISGNTTEYVSARCTNPIRDFIINSQIFRTGIANFTSYSLNGGFIAVFDESGAEDGDKMRFYNKTKKMPPALADELKRIMDKALLENISAPLDELITIRSGRTTVDTRWPLIQKRAGVQICAIGVTGDVRDRIIDCIRGALSSKAAKLLNIQPGGQYTIDGAMNSLQKKDAGKDFSERYNLGHLFYLGDAVYKHDTREGNDFSMVHNEATTVLAVNQSKEEVPDHKSVSWIGKGPIATYEWLTWFLIESANNIVAHSPSRRNEILELFQYLGFFEDGK